MFVDASATCAIALGENDREYFLSRIEGTVGCSSSAMAIWESVTAVARTRDIAPVLALAAVMELLDAMKVRIVPIPPEATALAVEAFQRFGKGRHPAGLNFGDCFAYACARHLDVPLLFKGDDFTRTDVRFA